MSFHKKNIHSLPTKRFFWFEPPLLLPPPQTFRKCYLIFIYFPCNLVFKPPFPSKFPVNLFRCQVWFFFLKFIRQVLIVPFGHWMLAKIQGRVRASVVEQKINGGEFTLNLAWKNIYIRSNLTKKVLNYWCVVFIPLLKLL